MPNTVRLGLVGFGRQMQCHHLPYLLKRRDIEIAWISGFLKEHETRITSALDNVGIEESGIFRECEIRAGLDACLQLLGRGGLDGVLISIPNALHAEPIHCALEQGVNVAVDKPPTTTVAGCAHLVALAEDRSLPLVFVTLSQRRYEQVYQQAAEHIRRGELGRIRLINYMMAHPNYDPTRTSWESCRKLSGGGALLNSGFHGIDTILWLLSLYDPPVRPRSVSARLCLDDSPETRGQRLDEVVESVAVARILLDNGGIFSAIASYESPSQSIDENIKIFGDRGALRIMRDVFRKKPSDMSAANLSYQDRDGREQIHDTRGCVGARWRPLADFLDAVIKRKNHEPWTVLSPAKDSIQTLRVIEGAYESASRQGQEIALP